MIFDQLKYSETYRNLHEQFPAAFAFLQRADLESLATGKYPIEGEEAFASVQEYCAKAEQDGRFEAHEKYLDIQYIISGCEKMICGPKDSFEVSEAYDAAKDVCFYRAKGITTTLLAKAGDFAVFYPQDIHKPGIAADSECSIVKKVVVKIRLR